MAMAMGIGNLMVLAAGAVGAPCPTCGHVAKSDPLMWLVIGFMGQAVFTARFLAQWIASEKKKDAVVPVIFWWLSLVGGMTLLAYAVHRADPVIVVGQSMGVFIYIRNLMLVKKRMKREAKAAARAAAGQTTVTIPHATDVSTANVRVDSAEAPRGNHGRDPHLNGTGYAKRST
jgi:lipid-A-disaccharide synthase-like uncharacterized protein